MANELEATPRIPPPWSSGNLRLRRARRDADGGFGPTPLALLARARERDGAALSELCRLYWPPIWRFIDSLGGRDDAKDVAQEYLMKLLRRSGLTRFDPERQSFRAFLRTGAKRYYFNLLARRRRERALGDALALAHQVTLAPPTPERLVRRRRVLALVERAWQRLARSYEAAGERTLFEHLYRSLHGEPTPLDDAELGEKLGYCPSYVGVRRHQLRRHELPAALLRESGWSGDARRLLQSLLEDLG